jgi:hypothetical protein
MDVVAVANRPVLVEPFLYSVLASQGRWDAAPLVQQICRGNIELLVLDRSLETPQVYEGYTLWPAPVLHALQNVMVFEGMQAGRWIYTPRQGTRTAPPPGCLA